MNVSVRYLSKLEKVLTRIKNERKKVAAIHKSFSSFPDGIEAHYDFYNKIMLGHELPLARAEREYLAILTSENNSCPYCIEHHREAALNFDLTISKERVEFYKELAFVLTKEPWKSSVMIKKSKEALLSSAEYSHALMIVAYFNMANRLAFGLDVQLEDDFQESCH